MIFVDSEYHCHATNADGSLREVKDPFFVGKCKRFIEGFCYDDRNGVIRIYSWKPYPELAAAQAQYEEDLAEAVAAYQEGVNSAYDQ